NYIAAGTTIISHAETRRLLSVDDTFDKAGLPVLTFSDRATFHLNGQTLELIPFANAHTLSDTIVRFVEANVIHASDLFFNKIFPFMDLENGGNYQQMYKSSHPPTASGHQSRWAAARRRRCDERANATAYATAELSSDRS
ncbi:MAG: hypothetical protein AAF982_04190, partial [Pseudomonadota bacterium]